METARRARQGVGGVVHVFGGVGAVITRCSAYDRNVVGSVSD